MTGAPDATPAGAGARGPASDPGGLAAPRRKALLSLAADPDPAIWSAVRAELEPHLEGLRRPLARLERSPEPLLRARARSLLRSADRRAALRRLERTSLRPELDLEAALWRLSALADPGFDARPYRQLLDAWAERVTERASGRSAGNARNIALAEILGGEIGLRGPDDDYHHPDRIYLHRTLDTRRGMPLTLVAVYLAVARRAGLRAAPVPLPGHVMLRLHGTSGSVLVDPFHSGAVRTKKDCEGFLAQHGLQPDEAWFADASDRRMFARHLLNLARSLGARRQATTARSLDHLSRRLHLLPS